MAEKDEIMDSLASKANEIMAENRYYHKKLSLYEKYINLTKEVITQCLSKNNTELAIECFDKYIEEIQKDYDNLNKVYENKELPEYNELIDNCFSETTMGKPILEQNKNNKFYLEYSKLEKESIIKQLKKSIKSSKEYQLFREPSRYTLVDVKEGAKEIEKTTNELQQNMLYELKKCNKFKERIFKYNNQIKDIEKNIGILKGVMKSDENIINNINNEIKEKTKQKINFPINQKGIFISANPNIGAKNFLTQSHNPGIFDFDSNKIGKNYEEDEANDIENIDNNVLEGGRIAGGGSGDRERKNHKSRKLKEKNKIILKFKKVEDLFEISSEDPDKENIIDDELNSDDEIVFAERVNHPIKLSEYHIMEVEKEIPKINLDQIEYNKMKIIKEDNLYSIQRRKYRSQNIDGNIKELKKNIEKMKQKLEKIKEKEKIMKDYIEKVKQNLKDLRRFKRTPSVRNQKTKLIKKSLIYKGDDNIKEEDIDEDSIDNDNEENEYGSDYMNEEKEEEENQIINHNIKQSVEVGLGIGMNLKFNKGKNFLGKSVRDDTFKNNLRNKLKKSRAKSK